MATRPDAWQSIFVRTRDLRLHLRVVGPENAPLVFVLHGWSDSSASFVPLIVELCRQAGKPLRVVLPDHRGFGYSGWTRGGYYWFPDYVADFTAIVEHFAPDGQTFAVVGHSMGAQVASLYAGLRPARVSRLVLMDGLSVADMPVAMAPTRYGQWVKRSRWTHKARCFADFATLAERIRVHQPRLSAAQALFLAHCWAAPDATGTIRLLADPVHRTDGPMLYRSAEAEAIWRCVTAPTLFLLARESTLQRGLGEGEYQRRQTCFATHSTVWLERTGHLMHVEAPERCAATLAAFLLGESSRAPDA